MSDTKRRTFLKKAVLGAAAIGISGFIPERSFGAAPDGSTKLAFRSLGSTGLKVTEIGFGAMNMRDPELVRKAIDSGINYIDTAYVYMKGANEETIGEVMQTERKKVFLSTKIPKGSYADIISMTETSLKRLRTDYVDVLLLHNNRTGEEILKDDYLKAFQEMKKKGMCRFIGISVHSNQAEVLDAAVKSKVWEVVQVGYNYLSPPSVDEAIERTRKAGLGIVAMKNILNQEIRPWKPIEGIDKTGKLTPAQSLIKWVLQNKNVDVTVPGMTAFEHVAEDVALMGMKSSSLDEPKLRKYGESMHGRYCRGVAGCTGCMGQCPKGVEVCELNRCLGYVYGYGDMRLAHENYAGLPASSKIEKCGDCIVCKVKCVNGLDLNGSINRARELFG
jgi:uncharacterized protein